MLKKRSPRVWAVAIALLACLIAGAGVAVASVVCVSDGTCTICWLSDENGNPTGVMSTC